MLEFAEATDAGGPENTRVFSLKAELDQIDRDVDVATSRLGIGADLMCGIHNRLGNISLQTW